MKAYPPPLHLAPILRGVAAESLSSEQVDLLLAHGCSRTDVHRLNLSWTALAKRDLNAATDTAGGYLIDGRTDPVEVALRPFSSIVQAGARSLSNLKGNVQIPRETTAPTAYWLSDENDPITESTPAVGAVNLTPHHVGAYVEFSKLLQVNAPLVEGYLQRTLVGAIAEAIDTAALNGAGASGEPLGIVAAAGTTTSGTTFAWSHVLAATEIVRDAGGRNLAWILSPDVAELAASRARLTNGSIPILHDGLIDGRPAIVTRACPDATAILADWSQSVVIAAWDSVRVEIDPFTGFATGKKGARVLAAVDVAVVQPAAVVAITGID